MVTIVRRDGEGGWAYRTEEVGELWCVRENERRGKRRVLLVEDGWPASVILVGECSCVKRAFWETMATKMRMNCNRPLLSFGKQYY